MTYTLDAARSEVSIGGVLHRLTPTQRTVLLVLLSAEGRPVTNAEIARVIGWPADMTSRRAVKANVTRWIFDIRAVLGDSAIITLPGAYALNVGEIERCPTCGRIA